MKALYWARIQSCSTTATSAVAPARMIWDEIEDVAVPADQLETLFSKVAVKVQAKEKVEVKAETKVNLAKIKKAQSKFGKRTIRGKYFW